MMLSDVCLSRTSGLCQEQRGLERLKLAQRYPTSHVTRIPLSRSKGHRGRGILWRPLAQLVSIKVACLCEVYCDGVHFQEAFSYVSWKLWTWQFCRYTADSKACCAEAKFVRDYSLGLSMYTERAFFLCSIYILYYAFYNNLVLLSPAVMERIMRCLLSRCYACVCLTYCTTYRLWRKLQLIRIKFSRSINSGIWTWDKFISLAYQRGVDPRLFLILRVCSYLLMWYHIGKGFYSGRPRPTRNYGVGVDLSLSEICILCAL